MTSTGTVGAGLAGARPVLVRARHMGGAEPAGGRGGEVARMRRDHHALARREIERLRGGEVDARLRLVVAGDLGAEDRVPGQLVRAARDRP